MTVRWKGVGRKKTTIYIEEELLRSTRVLAARTGRRDSDVVQDALRSYLGVDVLDRVWGRSDLDEAQALDLAYEEIHRGRRRRS